MVGRSVTTCITELGANFPTFSDFLLSTPVFPLLLPVTCFAHASLKFQFYDQSVALGTTFVFGNLVILLLLPSFNSRIQPFVDLYLLPILSPTVNGSFAETSGGAAASTRSKDQGTEDS